LHLSSKFIDNLSLISTQYLGTDANDFFEGTANNDVIIGGGGSNTLSGGAGNDIIFAHGLEGIFTSNTSTTDSTLPAPAATAYADALTGGTGKDTFVFSYDKQHTVNDTITDFKIGEDKIRFSEGLPNHFSDILAAATQQGADTVITFKNMTVTLNNVDLTQLTPSDFGFENKSTKGDDDVFGTKGNDTLDGLGGNNTLNGGGGNDLLIGDTGHDVLIGGTGVDTIAYSRALSGVNVNLTTGLGSSGDALGDIYTGIENALGSSLSDVLTGSAGSNSLDGGAGTDSLSGGAGADSLTGGLGNDTLIGGIGADNLNGGTGEDIADYSQSLGGVIVNLNVGFAYGGDASGDKLTSIEDVTGSSKGDRLAGDANANILTGQDGNDTLSGGAGNDSLLGGTGNDTLLGGSGNDTLIAGEAYDTFSFGGMMPSMDYIPPVQTNSSSVMTGGAGADTFVLAHSDTNTGNDIVTDFQANDIMQLSGQFAGSFIDAISHATQQGANTVFQFDHETITLNNVQLTSLTADNFTYTEVFYPM
jgi:Ca2+-binding RTX toxin-like protein